MNPNVDPATPYGSADRPRRITRQINPSDADYTGSWPVLGSSVLVGAISPPKYPRDGGD